MNIHHARSVELCDANAFARAYTQIICALAGRHQTGRSQFSKASPSMRANSRSVTIVYADQRYGNYLQCPSGHHDDLGISCAMLVWLARHPHLPSWVRTIQRPRPEAASWTECVGMDVRLALWSSNLLSRIILDLFRRFALAPPYCAISRTSAWLRTN